MELSFYILSFIITHPVAFLALVAWSFLAKGAALLRAFERKERGWFAALLLINTLGILEVFYLYNKRKPKTAAHKEAAKEAASVKEGLPAVALAKEGEITYDDFSKIELRIAKVMEAVRVEKSEKLIKLQLEVGDEKRQVVAGIGKAYTPENLVGKKIVIVANLAPKALMGVESHGMLLAAGGAEHPVLLSPEKEIESGAKVK